MLFGKFICVRVSQFSNTFCTETGEVFIVTNFMMDNILQEYSYLIRYNFIVEALGVERLVINIIDQYNVITMVIMVSSGPDFLPE